MITALITFVFSVAIWCIAPHITLNHVQPLASVSARVSMILMVMLFALIKPMIQWLKAHKGQYKAEIVQLKNTVLGFFTKIRDRCKQLRFSRAKTLNALIHVVFSFVIIGAVCLANLPIKISLFFL